MDLPVELRDLLLNALRGLQSPLGSNEREVLERALETGELSGSAQVALAALVEQLIHTGQVRRLHGPHADMALRALYRRLPPARQLTTQLKQLADALTGLRGQAIRDVSISLVGPCTYQVTIDTDQCRVLLELGPAGPELKAVELGL